jgi:hypothetical protein
MVRPNLFIVGAPKCGTTAWVTYLSTHKDIYFSPSKEPHFFCTDFPNYRWAKSLAEYEALFSGAKSEKVIGEASVRYLYSEVAARNIWSYNSDAKILIFLRRQSDFLPSYHHQLLYNRDECIDDFDDAWHGSFSNAGRQIPPYCREPKFLDYPEVGRFSEQVKRYIEVFPRQSVKVIWFEDWIGRPRDTYVEILDFLNLEDDERSRFEMVNSAKYHRFKFIGDITQRPPTWVLNISKVIKKFLRLNDLGIARFVRRLNRVQGYRTEVSSQLAHEIDQYYADDNKKLERILASDCQFER